MQGSQESRDSQKGRQVGPVPGRSIIKAIRFSKYDNLCNKLWNLCHFVGTDVADIQLAASANLTNFSRTMPGLFCWVAFFLYCRFRVLMYPVADVLKSILALIPGKCVPVDVHFWLCPSPFSHFPISPPPNCNLIWRKTLLGPSVHVKVDCR